MHLGGCKHQSVHERVFVVTCLQMAQDDQDASHRSVELQLSGRIKQVEQLLQGQLTGHHDLAALKTLTDKVRCEGGKPQGGICALPVAPLVLGLC